MGVYTGDELDDLIRENIRLTKENNKLLRKMRRTELFGIWLRIIFVLIILGMPFLLYRYYLEPYVQDLGATYQMFKEDSSALKELPGKLQVPEVVRQFVSPSSSSTDDVE